MYYKRGHNSLGETSDQRHRDGGSETEQGGPEPIPGLLEGFDLLTALGRLPLEHVAVVGFGRGGELGQRGAAPAVGTWNMGSERRHKEAQCRTTSWVIAWLLGSRPEGHSISHHLLEVPGSSRACTCRRFRRLDAPTEP